MQDPAPRHRVQPRADSNARLDLLRLAAEWAQLVEVIVKAKPHRHDYRFNLHTLCVCGVTRESWITSQL